MRSGPPKGRGRENDVGPVAEVRFSKIGSGVVHSAHLRLTRREFIRMATYRSDASRCVSLRFR